MREAAVDRGTDGNGIGLGDQVQLEALHLRNQKRICLATQKPLIGRMIYNLGSIIISFLVYLLVHLV